MSKWPKKKHKKRENIDLSYQPDPCVDCAVRRTYKNQLDYYSSLIRSSALDVEPKRGKWVIDDNILVCSECREPAMQRVFYSLTYHTTDIKMVKTPYCPHCGALMMEGDGTDEVD